jgi:hypothetical protein
MGGGLMQLVAYGAQDIYLTGSPQITFFKVVYRRHTNFSMEAIEQTFNGVADWGKQVSCIISRNGDLMHRVYLQTTLPAMAVSGTLTNSNISVFLNSTLLTSMSGGMEFHWVNWIGHQMIRRVDVEIGGQRIDRHYGEWLHIWNELTQTAEHEAGYSRMVGNVPKLVTTPYLNPANLTYSIPATTLYIPLQFWFCRNPGLALPLIALQYHEVKINIEFNSFDNCFILNNSPGVALDTLRRSLENTSLWVDYIYLDTDERRRFAQVAHEYLIEQLQFTGEETVVAANNKIRLSYNHPVKELIWVTQTQGSQNAKQWTNFSNAVDLSFSTGITDDVMGQGLYGPYNPGFGFDVNGNLVGTGLTTSGAGTIPPYTATTALSGLRAFDTGLNPTLIAKLQLNGQDRFAERYGEYFNYVQTYQHHTRTPQLGINVYSFALKPEEHQPSGTCNFSRIDNASLFVTLNTADNAGNVTISSALPAKVRIYATNYNVLRIMSGMGGLAYSN